jgi:alkylation response protein AidB-like acyl-CoA dehydrogenase
VAVGHSSAQAVGLAEARDILAQTTSRMLRDLADPQALAAAPDAAWRAPLWSALEDAGLTRAWVPEALNGAGAGIADGFEVLRIAGAFAVAVPLAETLLAGWLLSQAGLRVPQGMLSVAPVRAADRIRLNADGTLSGRAGAVPFARDAAQIAILAQGEKGAVVALVERAHCALEHGTSIAGEPRDNLVLERAAPSALAAAPAGFGEDALLCMGAAVRATQMSGALQAILERSVAYANERVAFERPISKFQAIQHNLARLAGESAAALAAAGSAADAIADAGGFDEGVLLELASAKIRVGEAAGEGAAIAHQVHGAIGFSGEHALHRYTQRLWAWRDDFGGESTWAVRLGQMVAAKGADALWPMLAER